MICSLLSGMGSIIAAGRLVSGDFHWPGESDGPSVLAEQLLQHHSHGAGLWKLDHRLVRSGSAAAYRAGTMAATIKSNARWRCSLFLAEQLLQHGCHRPGLGNLDGRLVRSGLANVALGLGRLRFGGLRWWRVVRTSRLKLVA
jgi:hypothetical protein